MATVTITLDVRDFDLVTPAAAAVLRVARATPTIAGDVIISSEIRTIPLRGIPTVDLEAGTVYWFSLTGVRGLPSSWYAATATSMSLAALYRTKQVDRSTLQPLPTFPSLAAVIANLQARIAALEAGAVTPPPAAVVVQSSTGGVLVLSGSGVTETAGVITLSGPNVTESNGVVTIS